MPILIDDPLLKSITLLRENISDWSSYPFNIPIIRNLKRLQLTRRVSYFVGENGSGKSTIIEAIAAHCGFGKEGGSQNINFRSTKGAAYSAGYLANYLRLSWTKKLTTGFFLRAESLFNIATYLDELQQEDYRTLRSYGGKSLHKQSHGESFMALIQNRFRGNGLYILDEPEAALSPQRQLSYLVLMHQILENFPNSQFLIATHSPIILAYPNAQILTCDNSSIEEIKYEQTGPYTVLGGFLANPSAYLRYLLSD